MRHVQFPLRKKDEEFELPLATIRLFFIPGPCYLWMERQTDERMDEYGWTNINTVNLHSKGPSRKENPPLRDLIFYPTISIFIYFYIFSPW